MADLFVPTETCFALMLDEPPIGGVCAPAGRMRVVKIPAKVVSGDASYPQYLSEYVFIRIFLIFVSTHVVFPGEGVVVVPGEGVIAELSLEADVRAAEGEVEVIFIDPGWEGFWTTPVHPEPIDRCVWCSVAPMRFSIHVF